MRRHAANGSRRGKSTTPLAEGTAEQHTVRQTAATDTNAVAAPQASPADHIRQLEAQLEQTRAELAAREAEIGALQQSEQRLRSTLEVLPVGVWFADENGKLVQGNAAGKRIWGGARYVGLEGYGEFKGWWANTGQRIEAHDWALARAVKRGEISLQELVEIESFDGERKVIHNSAMPIRAEDGRINGAVMVNEDVTERQLADNAQWLLAELGRMLGASLDAPPEMSELAHLLVPRLADCCAVSLLSPDGKVVDTAVAHVDPETEKLTRELAARCTLARRPGVQPATQAVVLDGAGDRLVRTRARSQAQLAILLQLNPRSWMEIPISAHGRFLGVIEVARFDQRRPFGRRETALIEDMAQRIAVAEDNLRLYHELQETARRKDHFLAMLGHELRNPLAAVTASLHVLQHTDRGSDQARRSETVIARQVAHLTRLVDDLLDLTRVSRGTVRLHREPVDAVEVIRRVIEDHHSVFERRQIELRLVLPNGPVVLEADATRLEQIVGNLLQNAVKFTDHGGRVVVTLSEEGDPRTAKLTVTDDGIGMDPAMLEHLFEPFNQAERSLARTRGGLGLGLALVRSLVELHGGSVEATSPGPDRGSTFAVRLPTAARMTPAPAPSVRAGTATTAAAAVTTLPPLGAVAAPNATSTIATGPAAAPAAVVAAPAAPGAPATREPALATAPRLLQQGRRVLLIEDNADAAHSLREALELGSHQVEIAYGGRDGLRKARIFRPEVVLCDIGLPDMTGYEVARALRSDESLRGIVLVALTGYVSREDQSQAVQAGFDRHIAKPPSIDKLEEMLAKVGAINA